jgi:hypothetical protein
MVSKCFKFWKVLTYPWIFSKKKWKGNSYGCLSFYLLGIMRKTIVLQLALQLSFEFQWPLATHYIYDAMQLQFYLNNSFSIIMQFHYNYSHNVMLTLLIFIHPLKFDMWFYEDFWIWKLFSSWSTDFHHLLLF